MSAKAGRRFVGTWGVLAVYAWLAACVTSGRDIRFADTQKLVVGVSSRADAEALFGPAGATTTENGKTFLGWTYEQGGERAIRKELILSFGTDGKYLGVFKQSATDPAPAAGWTGGGGW